MQLFIAKFSALNFQSLLLGATTSVAAAAAATCSCDTAQHRCQCIFSALTVYKYIFGFHIFFFQSNLNIRFHFELFMKRADKWPIFKATFATNKNDFMLQ